MRNQLLKDSDVMSMVHGLELRLPLVDCKLFDALAPIPASIRLEKGKGLLKRAVPEIPLEVASAAKRGFSFPFDRWLSAGLAARLAEVESGLPVRPAEWYQRWSVLAFANWSRRWTSHHGPFPHEFLPVPSLA